VHQLKVVGDDDGGLDGLSSRDKAKMCIINGVCLGVFDFVG